jgi:hypothetical protein
MSTGDYSPTFGRDLLSLTAGPKHQNALPFRQCAWYQKAWIYNLFSFYVLIKFNHCVYVKHHYIETENFFIMSVHGLRCRIQEISIIFFCGKSLCFISPSRRHLNKAHVVPFDQWFSGFVWSPTGVGLHACKCIHHSNPYLIILYDCNPTCGDQSHLCKKLHYHCKLQYICNKINSDNVLIVIHLDTELNCEQIVRLKS